jgi:predicted transcriptional regulator of viral defense system
VRRKTISRPDLKPHGFFATHPYFRFDEFADAYREAGHSHAAVTAVLAYHVSTGTLINLRRGLYRVAHAPFEPWLIPSKLNRHAVVAYDGAASFHGLTPVGHSLTFLSPRSLGFTLNEVVYRGVAWPDLADPAARVSSGFAELPKNGHPIAVTSLERTLADCLERTDLAPDFHHLFGGFLDKPDLPLDLDQLVHYTVHECSPICAARVGLLLCAHPHHRYAREHLATLAKRVPARTSYATPDREPGGKYFARWRLVVPRSLADHL